MRDFLSHLFIPQESNNHRAKILHHEILLVASIFFILGTFFISNVKKNFAEVLGVATNISASDLLKETNEIRKKQGFSELRMNNDLARAALNKAKDMFTKNYWAHNAPDGNTPWFFIKQSGYEYVYAGENLARGFSNSQEIVNAWMASPSHRANMLSSNYEEIGFAVVDGNLIGEDTTLVVEMFGSKNALEGKTFATKGISSVPVKQVFVQSVEKKPLINNYSFSWSVSLIILSAFIFILLLDMLIIERKKIARFVGHNTDHILFFIGLSILVLIFTKGIII